MARPKSFRRYPKCDRCRRSTPVIAYGTRGNRQGRKQLWFCTACQHKFSRGDERKKMSDPFQESRLAAMALWLRFHAVSGRALCSFLREFFDVGFTPRGLTQWLHRHRDRLIHYLQRSKPRFRLGQIWQADELFVKARRKLPGSWAYWWVVLDRQTRVITTYLSRQRNAPGFARCFGAHWLKLAGEDLLRLWQGDYGLVLVTDGARAYPKGLQHWDFPVQHVPAHIQGVAVPPGATNCPMLEKSFGERVTNNALEGLNSQLRPWIRRFRGVKGIMAGRKWVSWYEVCYNFLQAQEGLDGRTPAEVAGVQLGLGEYRWITALHNVVQQIQFWFLLVTHRLFPVPGVLTWPLVLTRT